MSRSLAQETAIEAILEKVGVNGRKETIRVVFCFWKLGPGWHTYAELNQVFVKQWPHSDDVKNIRAACQQLNDEVEQAGNGAIANHIANCSETTTHAICHKKDSPGLIALEPYLSTIVDRACEHLTPANEKNEKDKQVKRRRRNGKQVEQDIDKKDVLGAVALEKLMENVRTEAQNQATLVAERHMIVATEKVLCRIGELSTLMTNRQTAYDTLRATNIILQRERDELDKKCEILGQMLRQSEAAEALTSLQRCN